MNRAASFALALAWLAGPAAVHAILGVGDIVYDPTATAQAINLLHQSQQEFDRLGSLLGVSTKQYDQLLALAGALGNATESAPFALPASPAQLQSGVQALPGLQGADLGSLFNPNGILDAFLGVPPDSWAQAVENPNAAYRAILVDPAIARVGAAAGLASPAITYAQWYAARSPEDRHNLAARAAVDLAAVLAGDFLNEARKRRVNLQALAVEGQGAGAQAGRAQTVADQQHAQARLASGTNAILLESAVQNAEAGETTVRALHAQNQLLQEQGESRRNAEEMQLDAR
jgi:hypothetical protein